MAINYKFDLKEPISGKSSIKFRFDHKGKRFVYGTGQTINPELWDKETQRPITNKKLIDQFEKIHPQIKTELENVTQRLENIISVTKKFISLKGEQNEPVNFDELKDYLNKQFEVIKPKKEKKLQVAEKETGAPFIKDVVYQFAREMSSGKKTIQMPLKRRGQKYSDSTIQDYLSFHKMLLELEAYHKREYRVTDISKDFDDDLHEFFNEKEYMPKTKGTKIKIMKSVIHDFIVTEYKKLYDKKIMVKKPF